MNYNLKFIVLLPLLSWCSLNSNTHTWANTIGSFTVYNQVSEKVTRIVSQCARFCSIFTLWLDVSCEMDKGWLASLGSVPIVDLGLGTIEGAADDTVALKTAKLLTHSHNFDILLPLHISWQWLRKVRPHWDLGWW